MLKMQKVFHRTTDRFFDHESVDPDDFEFADGGRVGFYGWTCRYAFLCGAL